MKYQALTKSLLLITFFSLSIVVSAQDSGTRIKKFEIGESGCAVYLPAQEVKWDKSGSEDGSDVYTGEISYNGFNFFVIAVKFKDDFTGSSSDEVENLLISYLDYLKQQFKITGSAGYGKGHYVKGHDVSAGVIDYWKDDEGENWKIKGQITLTNLMVVGVYGAGDPEKEPTASLALDGLVFPAPLSK